MSIESINGKIIDTAVNPKDVQIQRTGQKFKKEGYMGGINNSTQFQANFVLASLGIAGSRETKDFTLSSTNDGGFENNLISDKANNLKPEPETPNDKFSEFEAATASAARIDSFYNLDEDLTEKQKSEIEMLRTTQSQIVFKLALRLSLEKLPTQADMSINKYFAKDNYMGIQS